MALADSLSLKAMVEFKSEMKVSPSVTTTNMGKVMTSFAVCRFCHRHNSADLPVMDSVCQDKECLELVKLACQKVHPCGHHCGGIIHEEDCLPCLHGCSSQQEGTPLLRQDADDMCMICFTEALSPIPSILLKCGHVFHFNCCKTVLEKRWNGPRITFGFRNCPICKAKIEHEALKALLEPLDALEEDVRKKALMRLEYEGMSKCEAVTSKGKFVRSNRNPSIQWVS